MKSKFQVAHLQINLSHK